MDKKDYPTTDEEIIRYESHNNDVEDPRYQKFVSPLVNKILANFSQDHKGLDFGAGTGPVITKMLTDEGYDIITYDPYFDNDKTVFDQRFDYIVSCEVIEHFHEPYTEFERLRKMLKPGGALFLKTDVYTEDRDFHAWYYKSDETHVFFYHPYTFKWIKNEFSFNSLEIDGRHISLSA
ncbi:class I SAM-dependent methyltransferase [Gracilimonas sp. Q87]|uniref:class I SAM-dependent methyltransferase n=1 Tax=Gracilimonas sp. Q87 TaxID=3384766 RepID=UPI0039844789